MNLPDSAEHTSSSSSESECEFSDDSPPRPCNGYAADEPINDGLDCLEEAFYNQHPNFRPATPFVMPPNPLLNRIPRVAQVTSVGLNNQPSNGTVQEPAVGLQINSVVQASPSDCSSLGQGVQEPSINNQNNTEADNGNPGPSNDQNASDNADPGPSNGYHTMPQAPHNSPGAHNMDELFAELYNAIGDPNLINAVLAIHSRYLITTNEVMNIKRKIEELWQRADDLEKRFNGADGNDDP